MNTEKINMFQREINYIKTERYRENIKKLISCLPDYFFEIPASSTWKYHPNYALGEGGLVRHTKVAVRIAYELLNDESIGYQFKAEEKDMILMSLILHDGLKSGNPKEKYTRFDHPILMGNYVVENKEKIGLTEEDAIFCSDAIKTHMGNWITDYNGNEVLEKPKTKYQNFVHMCDYLASRKCILVPFDSNNKIST